MTSRSQHPDGGEGRLVHPPHDTNRPSPGIAALAERQHGVVSRTQLVDIGLGRRAIEHRVAGGVLHPVHRGVYAVGHRRLSREGRWMAAVLACGHGAVPARRSAGALWGIVRVGGPPEVTAPANRVRPGIAVSRCGLAADEWEIEDGIPVTTPARTLLDLAAALSRPRLELALDRAESLRLGSPTSLAVLLERHRGRRGTATLRAALDGRGVLDQITRSELEEAFYVFLAGHGLPRPRTNWIVAPYELDMAWPEVRLVVELDSRAHHLDPAAFERDRAKDRALALAGWLVIRVTARQLRDEPDVLAGDLRHLIRARRGTTCPPSA